MRTAIRRQGDRIETLDYTLIQVARGPVTIKVVMKNVTIETVDGKPLEMHTEQVFGSQPVRYDATFAAGRDDRPGDHPERQHDHPPPAGRPDGHVPVADGPRAPGGQAQGAASRSRERGYAFVADTKPLAVEHKAARAKATLSAGRPEVAGVRYKVSNPAMGGEGDVLLRAADPDAAAVRHPRDGRCA